jgi:membrane protein YdbS with pleckstrin-like domain
VHRWEADEQAVYTLTGWLKMEWRVAPISRIQTIDTERAALQRLFGLATVTVTTASAAGPVTIEGLDAGAAAELARRLTEITQADPGDAT